MQTEEDVATIEAELDTRTLSEDEDFCGMMKKICKVPTIYQDSVLYLIGGNAALTFDGRKKSIIVPKTVTVNGKEYPVKRMGVLYNQEHFPENILIEADNITIDWEYIQHAHNIYFAGETSGVWSYTVKPDEIPLHLTNINLRKLPEGIKEAFFKMNAGAIPYFAAQASDENGLKRLNGEIIGADKSIDVYDSSADTSINLVWVGEGYRCEKVIIGSKVEKIAFPEERYGFIGDFEVSDNPKYRIEDGILYRVNKAGDKKELLFVNSSYRKEVVHIDSSVTKVSGGFPSFVHMIIVDDVCKFNNKTVNLKFIHTIVLKDPNMKFKKEWFYKANNSVTVYAHDSSVEELRRVKRYVLKSLEEYKDGKTAKAVPVKTVVKKCGTEKTDVSKQETANVVSAGAKKSGKRQTAEIQKKKESTKEAQIKKFYEEDGTVLKKIKDRYPDIPEGTIDCIISETKDYEFENRTSEDPLCLLNILRNVHLGFVEYDQNDGLTMLLQQGKIYGDEFMSYWGKKAIECRCPQSCLIYYYYLFNRYQYSSAEPRGMALRYGMCYQGYDVMAKSVLQTAMHGYCMQYPDCYEEKIMRDVRHQSAEFLQELLTEAKEHDDVSVCLFIYVLMKERGIFYDRMYLKTICENLEIMHFYEMMTGEVVAAADENVLHYEAVKLDRITKLCVSKEQKEYMLRSMYEFVCRYLKGETEPIVARAYNFISERDDYKNKMSDLYIICLAGYQSAQRYHNSELTEKLSAGMKQIKMQMVLGGRLDQFQDENELIDQERLRKAYYFDLDEQEKKEKLGIILKADKNGDYSGKIDLSDGFVNDDELVYTTKLSMEADASMENKIAFWDASCVGGRNAVRSGVILDVRNDICTLDFEGEIIIGTKTQKLCLKAILDQNYDSCMLISDLSIDIQSSYVLDEYIVMEVELRFSPYLS